MTTFPREEIEATVAEYHAERENIRAGKGWWTDLARFFTDDAVYIDPAWGRVEGLDNIREFFNESMLGLEDWTFPITAVGYDANIVLVKWTQIFKNAAGTEFAQSGLSTMRYAGNGKFDYDEDILNMAHVNEDMRASEWRPAANFTFPPRNPNRNWSFPA